MDKTQRMCDVCMTMVWRNPNAAVALLQRKLQVSSLAMYYHNVVGFEVILPVYA